MHLVGFLIMKKQLNLLELTSRFRIVAMLVGLRTAVPTQHVGMLVIRFHTKLDTSVTNHPLVLARKLQAKKSAYLPSCCFRYYKNISLRKVAISPRYFYILYQYTKVDGFSVDPASQVCTSTKRVVLNVPNYQAGGWGAPTGPNGHSRLNENR